MTPRSRRRFALRPARVTVGIAAAALLLAACGDGSDERPDDGDVDGGGAAAVGPSEDPVDVDGLVYAVGSTVHLADGTEIDLGVEPEAYAPGGDGVFFTTPDTNLDEAAVATWSLSFADRDGEVQEVAGAVDAPRTSPDGEHLVYLDLGSGEPDDFGAPQAELVVVDLVLGEEVLRSTEYSGDPSADDFAVLYSESEIGVERVTDSTAYVDLGPDLEVDLTSGDITEVEATGPQWRGPVYEDPPSPDGAWRVEQTDDVRDRLVGPGGREVVPDVGTPRWVLAFWADDRTVVGWSVAGPVGPPRAPFSEANTYTLMTCEVPTGRCEERPGTEGETVRFPSGTTPTDQVTLRFQG